MKLCNGALSVTSSSCSTDSIADLACLAARALQRTMNSFKLVRGLGFLEWSFLSKTLPEVILGARLDPKNSDWVSESTVITHEI